MATARVLAVLVAHASGTWLSDTLASLRAQRFEGLDVVVATVGDVALPRGRRSFSVEPVPAESSFPQAVARVLAAHGGDEDYVLLLHDDVALGDGAVAAMVERAESDDGVGAVGAKLVEWDDPDVLQEVGASVDRFAIRRSGLEEHEVDHGQQDDADDVLFSSSACLLVRRSAFDAIGGLDPDAWPLYDDVDLCWRLHGAGHRVRVAPEARVRHVAAMSRGRRRAAGRGFGAMAVRTSAERGRLWFMLRNYERTTLALILPQYVLVSLSSLLTALVRREFWRVRSQLSGWSQVMRELPQVLEGRKRQPARVVGDHQLLHLAARRSLIERRYRWLAAGAGLVETLQRAEQRARALARDPVTWAWVASFLVIVVTLRGVLFGGAFTLGELRPIPAFSDAMRGYFARASAEGLDPYGPSSPGIVVLALPRLVGLSSAFAQKLTLVGPLVAAAAGAWRLARVVGLRGPGARWFAIGGAVNPVTLHLARTGSVGALVVWAGSMWVASSMLAPAPGNEDVRERLRRRSGWVLAWTAVTAVHPPGLVWLATLGAVLALARSGDGLGRRRWTFVVVGVVGALVASMPWSLEWLTNHTPLFGRAPGTLPGSRGGLAGSAFEVGWPLVALAAVAVLAAYAVGLTRTSFALSSMVAASWIAGSVGAVAADTALVGAGWCSLALLALAWRRVSEELRTYELGLRHALVIATVVAVAAVWAGSALAAVVGGARARTLEVVPTSADRVGRVLWIDDAGSAPRFWTTEGFHEPLRAFPIAAGPEDRLVAGALWAARADRTHRLGATLALADVSHVVAVTAAARSGLDRQADLAPAEEQTGAVVYRNDAWSGRVALLAAPPNDVLTPMGLADLVRDQRPIESTVRDGTIVVEVPEGTDGIVYVSGGARRGWSVADADATVAAAGIWFSAGQVSGTVEITPPGGVVRWLLAPQILVLFALVIVWAASVYLAAPGPRTPPAGPEVDLRAPILPRGARWVPVLAAVAAVGWAGWGVPRVVRADTFLSAAWYCPPAGEDFTQRLAIVNPTSGEATYLVRTDLTVTPTVSGTLGASERATVDADAEQGALVETYGVRVVVGAEVGLEGRRGAAGLCAPSPRRTYHFAEGGRAATRARPRLFERYVIYNPFTELARASVRFFPDATEEDMDAVSPPTLQDVQIPPGGSVIVDPEDVFFFPLRLSAVVDVWQGRAIVGHRLHTSEEVYWSLGTELVRSGVLHHATTDGALSRIVAFDPAQLPASVHVTGSGAQGAVPDLEFDVPETRRATFDLNDDVPDAPGLVVRVDADRPLAFETMVIPDDRTSISVIPLMQPARSWAIAAAEGRHLVVTNPNARAVRLRVTRLGPGPPIADQTVRSGRSLVLPLEGSRPFGLLVRADGGAVTAAAVGGAGAIAGYPTR